MRSSAVSSPSKTIGLGSAQGFDLAVDCEALERLGLDLANPLAGQAHPTSDLVERLRVRVAVEAVAHLYDLLLPVGEVLDRTAEDVLLQADLDPLLRRRFLAGDEVGERGFARLTDGSVEARDGPRCLTHFDDLLEGQFRRFGDLLLGRRVTELRRQLALGPRDLPLAVDDVDRDADLARFVGHAALYGLPNPPCGVGRELVAAAPVELLDGADQPDDPFLDQ